ncbi:polyprotein, partial [Cordyline virus 4]
INDEDSGRKMFNATLCESGFYVDSYCRTASGKILGSYSSGFCWLDAFYYVGKTIPRGFRFMPLVRLSTLFRFGLNKKILRHVKRTSSNLLHFDPSYENQRWVDDFNQFVGSRNNTDQEANDINDFNLVVKEYIEKTIEKNSVKSDNVALNNILSRGSNIINSWFDREDDCSVNFKMGNKEKKIVTDLFPELKIKFLDRSFSSHPIYSAVRHLSNFVFSKRLNSRSFLDFGGSIIAHCSNLNSDVHICSPIVDVRDDKRHMDQSLQLNRLFGANEGITLCCNRAENCDVKYDNAIAVEVYDMSLEVMAKAMLSHNCKRLDFSMLLPGEILLDFNEISLFNDSCRIVNESGKAKYFYGDAAESYDHSLEILRDIMRLQVIAVDGHIFKKTLEYSRGPFRFYSLCICQTFNSGISTFTTRYDCYESRKVAIRVPVSDIHGLISYDEIVVDKSFYINMVEYAANCIDNFNRKGYEHIMSHYRSRKSYTIYNGQVINEAVDIAPSFLPGFIAVVLAEGIRTAEKSNYLSRFVYYQCYAPTVLRCIYTGILNVYLRIKLRCYELTISLLKSIFGDWVVDLYSKCGSRVTFYKEEVECRQTVNIKASGDYNDVLEQSYESYLRRSEELNDVFEDKSKARSAVLQDLDETCSLGSGGGSASPIFEKIFTISFRYLLKLNKCKKYTMDKLVCVTKNLSETIYGLYENISNVEFIDFLKRAGKKSFDASKVFLRSKSIHGFIRFVAESLLTGCNNFVILCKAFKEYATSNVRKLSNKFEENVVMTMSKFFSIDEMLCVFEECELDFGEEVKGVEPDTPNERLIVLEEPNCKTESIEDENPTEESDAEIANRLADAISIGGGSSGTGFPFHHIVQKLNCRSLMVIVRRINLVFGKLLMKIKKFLKLGGLCFSVCFPKTAKYVRDVVNRFVELNHFYSNLYSTLYTDRPSLILYNNNSSLYTKFQLSRNFMEFYLNRIHGLFESALVTSTSVMNDGMRFICIVVLSDQNTQFIFEYTIDVIVVLTTVTTSGLLIGGLSKGALIGAFVSYPFVSLWFKKFLKFREPIFPIVSTSLISLCSKFGLPSIILITATALFSKRRILEILDNKNIVPKHTTDYIAKHNLFVVTRAMSDLISNKLFFWVMIVITYSFSNSFCCYLFVAYLVYSANTFSNFFSTFVNFRNLSIVYNEKISVMSPIGRLRNKIRELNFMKIKNTNIKGKKLEAPDENFHGFESDDDELDVDVSKSTWNFEKTEDFEQLCKETTSNFNSTFINVPPCPPVSDARSKTFQSSVTDQIYEHNKLFFPNIVCDENIKGEVCADLASCHVSVPDSFIQTTNNLLNSIREFLYIERLNLRLNIAKLEKVVGLYNSSDKSFKNLTLKMDDRTVYMFTKEKGWRSLSNIPGNKLTQVVFSVNEQNILSDFNPGKDEVAFTTEDLAGNYVNKRLIGLERNILNIDTSFALVDKHVKLINKPPGSGKTTSIVTKMKQAIDKNRSTLAITVTKVGKKEIITKLSNFGIRDCNKFCITLDSFIMNDKLVNVDELYIDECFMAHSGALIYCLNRSKFKFCEFYGDVNQIPYICRIPHFSAIYQKEIFGHLILEFDNSSYRCPADTCYLLSTLTDDCGTAIYPNGVYAKRNTRVRTMELKPINGCEDIAFSKDTQYITFTHNEKNELLRINPNLRVCTVNESQGGTFKVVALVRTKTYANEIYSDINQIVTAISRHTDQFTYYNQYSTLNDKVSGMINGLNSVADFVISQFGFKQQV